MLEEDFCVPEVNSPAHLNHYWLKLLETEQELSHSSVPVLSYKTSFKGGEILASE